ncbi:MAG: hypothetical protein ALECFALPRED_001366 [Alectoria fallacina]|uniref:Transmembrane protein n=1 Tax=Alectoria fallacina TaxID=1903189 RepID=A0A8H3EWL7_9LECA|nr:MAG: hypothetical protein ALECFALPRED_009069 [Alectoria fallacina]CAF9919910.1 MAG: hypothetical protein ALECFALPRED_001366 [Alectoria fallacina]
MAGPRERSRRRGNERQPENLLQDRQTSHRRPTAEGSNDAGEHRRVRDYTDAPSAHGEDSYDDREYGHPLNSGAQRLDRRILRTCKERSAGALGTCKKGLAKHWMRILPATICIFLVYGLWNFCNLNRSAEPSKFGLGWSNRQPTRHYQSMLTVTHTASTAYIIDAAYHKQFHDARPVHHQTPMVVPSNLEATGQVIGQDLSHPHIVTAKSAPVSGLYFIPMSFTSGGWPQMQRDTHPSSCSARNTDGSQTLQRGPSFGSLEPEAKLLVQSRKIGAPRNLFPSQADTDSTSFSRWGVEVLYGLHRRRRRSIPFYEGCTKNVCSPHKQLTSMCNTSKTISDPFRKRECEWCWPENQRRQQEINDHCMEVSKRALNAIFISCGIFLFCTLAIAIVLATRILRRRRRTKADRILHKHASSASPLQEKTNSFPIHWFSLRTSHCGKSSETAKTKVDMAVRKRWPGEAVGQNPWYKAFFAKSGIVSGSGPENPDPGRLRLQKKRTKPFDGEIAIGDGEHERAPALPPAPPAISSRVFSDIENMGQGSLLSGPGTTISQRDPQGMPHRASRQSRAISSGSEQTSSGATHRRDAGAGLYDPQRLTELS